MRILALAVFAALSLGACGTTVGLPPVPIVSTANTTVDDKAYAEALNAYNTAAQAYLALNRQGLISAAVKDQVKAVSRTALAALNAADTARKAGNAASFTAQIALAAQAVAQIKALLPEPR